MQLFHAKLLSLNIGLASWECRTLAAACRLMFKYKYLPNLDTGRSGTRLQSGHIFHIDRPNTKKFINTSSYLFQAQWNNLPSYIRVINKQEHYNLLIKGHFISKYLSENTFSNTTIIS